MKDEENESSSEPSGDSDIDENDIEGLFTEPISLQENKEQENIEKKSKFILNR